MKFYPGDKVKDKDGVYLVTTSYKDSDRVWIESVTPTIRRNKPFRVNNCVDASTLTLVSAGSVRKIMERK